MISANDGWVSLPKESEKFLVNLLTKIGNMILDGQKSAYNESLTEDENLKQIDQSISELWRPSNQMTIGQMTTLTEQFHLPLEPYAVVDETTINSKNLNNLIIDMLELGMRNYMDLTHHAYVAKELYKIAKRPPEPISVKDSIMTHLAFTSASYVASKLTVESAQAELNEQFPIGRGLITPPPDEEELDKYMSIFNGEEYNHARENNPKGDIE